MAVNGRTISVAPAVSLLFCSCFWSFMEFLLSSRRLDKEDRILDYLRPFLWREIFHNCNLCISMPLFLGFDEIMTSRFTRRPRSSSRRWVFLTSEQTPPVCQRCERSA